MKIRLLSDLHREIPRYKRETETLQDVAADLVILAGDIDEPISAVAWAHQIFEAPVVYVAGNHEHYQGDLERRLDEAREAAERTSGHVRFLENGETEVAGWRVLGATLWTDYCLHGEPWQYNCMREAQRLMNDHRLILLGGKWFLPGHALDRHEASRLWLTSRLRTGDPDRTIVVTHHGISWQSVAPQWQRDMLTAAFVSDLSDLIMETQPALWVHGHVHSSFDYEIDRTRVVCNPKGYGPENGAWDPGLVIDLPDEKDDDHA